MKRREVILIVGRTGTGKSYLARSIYSQWPRRVIYDPHHEHAQQDARNAFPHEFKPFHVTTDDAEYAAQLALAAGNCVLVYDDAMTYLMYPLPSPFDQIVAAGRHKQLSIVAITQRLPDVAPALRAQVDVLVAFKQSMRYDARTLERDWGFDEEEVRRLKGREYRYEVYSDNPLQSVKELK